MDVDVVYTWVNHEDPRWQKLYQEEITQRATPENAHKSANDPARFTSRDEIYYSILSLQRYAPWVRKIFVLSNCAPKPWMHSISNLVYVKHEDVFPDPGALPTFNSHAIETVLHRIAGLSENFLYFNDDVFLCKEVRSDDFFWGNNCVYYFPSKHDIPDPPPSHKHRPVDNGAINASKLLNRTFGFQPEKKLHHAPFPLNRNLLQEIEDRYTKAISGTRSNKFRHINDVAMATTLHAYYAHCIGRGLAKCVSARYVDIGDPLFVLLIHPWSPLRRGKYSFLCLNEVTGNHHFVALRDSVIRRLMKSMFQSGT